MAERLIVWVLFAVGMAVPVWFASTTLWAYCTSEKDDPLGSRFNQLQHLFSIEFGTLRLSHTPNVTGAVLILIGLVLVAIGTAMFLRSSLAEEAFR